MKTHVLIVDDDANTLASLARAFRLAGHEATVCDQPAKVAGLLASHPFDILFSDVVMPGTNGLDLLAELRAAGFMLPVVMMSGQADIAMAVRATRLGAVDFLEKPVSTDKLLLTLENAVKLARLESENQQLRQQVGRHELVGSSAVMRQVLAQVDRVAASEVRVCILGETGTGKELVARALHERSPRRAAPFVTLNCAAVPAELIESELFGHEKGAFTGAAARHRGKFEQAHRGTLFLDEIGDMPLAMQTKLLRVLEEGEVERVGTEQSLKVDVRVVAATHRDLEALVRQEKFRQDLYHRIFVFPVRLPPLRERAEDIPMLVEHFARQVCATNGWRPTRFEPAAITALQRFQWPGNVRELRNAVERLLLLAESAAVTEHEVSLLLPAAPRGTAGPGSGPLAERLESVEREIVLAELRRQAFHMTQTAKALGLERSHFYKKCQQLGIDVQAAKQEAE